MTSATQSAVTPTETHVPAIAAPRVAAGDDPRTVRRPIAAAADDWPHTYRLVPWLIASFLAMLFLVPFDSTQLPAGLPFDSKLDRVLLAPMAFLWLMTACTARRSRVRFRITLIDYALFFVVTIAFASVIFNLPTLFNIGETSLAVKKLFVLLSFIAFFYIASSSIRPSEAKNFCMLVVGLAALMGLGITYEYRTSVNVFFNWTDAVLPGAFSVSPPPADPQFGRELVSGPTVHAIAAATLLAMALPFACSAFAAAKTHKRKILYGVAVGLILAGAISTVRKTGALAPATSLLVLCLYRPRMMLRMVPLGIIVLIFIQAAAPGALVRIKAQVVNVSGAQTTYSRKEDFKATKPDVMKHQLTGRGFGTYDPDRYRFLDNEYLGRLIETGYIGLASYILMIVAVIAVAHPSIRSGDPRRAPPALAAAAGAAAFGAASSFFDILAFPQAPYMFFFVAALAVVVAKPTPTEVATGLASSDHTSLAAR